MQRPLTQGIEQRALAIFQAIANAEGKIHNVPPEKVHFHEVGALDSIVDIVAAAICIEYLQPEFVLCGSIELGSGFVGLRPWAISGASTRHPRTVADCTLSLMAA
ncbi:MAG: hypothetical protein CM15mP120_20910 [Pseudomonadota bacterium]|nr:MAG: hypothetical protein CM15mP120_20910 [Pseudomonadota bacterium]